MRDLKVKLDNNLENCQKDLSIKFLRMKSYILKLNFNLVFGTVTEIFGSGAISGLMLDLGSFKIGLVGVFSYF